MPSHASRSKEYTRLLETPVPRLIFSLALPSVLTLLSVAVYNTADAFFAADLGTGAVGALGCLFPLSALIQAVGFTLGMGAGSLISRQLGEGRTERVQRLSAGAFWLALLLALLLAAFGLIFLSPLVRLLGATPDLQEETERCARYQLLASPVLIMGFVLSHLLRSEGRTDLSLRGIAAGSLLNIALDPLFMFTLGMGAAGAGAASLLSHAVGDLLLLLPFLRDKTASCLRPSSASRRPAAYGQILLHGLPSLLRQGLAAAAALLLNRQAALFGAGALAAMGIVNKLFQIFFSVSLGLGQGYQPAAGCSFGARRPSRLRQAFLLSLWSGVLLMTLLGIGLFFTAPWLLSFFSDDETVLAIALPALRALCLIFPLLPPSTLANLTYQAIGCPGRASFLAASRQGLFFIPLILLLPRFLDLTGVWLAQPAADLLTFLLCLPFLFSFLKKLKKEDASPKNS